MDKLGVFLCTGCGIGDAIDVDDVFEGAEETGCACTLAHECFCGPEGLEAIKNAVSENDLDGILIAACSERVKTGEFNALTEDGPAMFRTAIREYCSWPLKDAEDDEDKTLCAKDLVQMGLARLDGVKAIEKLEEEVSDTVMVVGSGRAGLEAALTASGLGHPVVLVEKDEKLGGLLAEQKSIPPEEDPYEQPDVMDWEVQNVSIGGFRVKGSVRGTPGSEIECVLTFPAAGVDIPARARVVWSEDGAPPTLGLEFAELQTGDRLKLAHALYLKRKLKDAA